MRLPVAGLLLLPLWCAALACVPVHAATLEPTLPGPGAPAGHGILQPDLRDGDARLPALPRSRETLARDGAARTALYPSYSWPMEKALHDGLVIVNYVDEDPSAGLLDYAGGNWTYDTHRGTDISLNDFKAMDRGCRIIAAAPGTVTFLVANNLRDRNCASPDNPTLNYMEVANGDGTYTYYYHLRANSATVTTGEAVQRGEVLALAGSSGYSSGPHLHFEPADFLSGPYVRRDPWGGPSNPNPSLWASQAPYEGAHGTLIYDLGVTTQAAVGGNLGNVDYCTYWAERVQQPAVFGIHEPWIPVWLSVQGRAGDGYRIEIHRPNASLYTSLDYVLPAQQQAGVHYWYWGWNGSVTAADQGTWTTKVLVNGVVVRQMAFTVGATTIYPPRFTPRGGRSFKVNGAVQRDTMHVLALDRPVSYTLVNAPSSVTLVDSILTLGATSSQPTRSAYFQVLATDAAARRDTAWFHVVDVSKPQEGIAGVDDPPPAPRLALALAPAFPDPSHGATALRFTLQRRGKVLLSVHDLAGRRVATLIDQDREPVAGGETAVWDGRDANGHAAPGGIYFARLVTADGTRVTRIARLP